MLNSLQNMAWWHWWIVGVALAALETVVPGAVVIWFGISALVVGTLLLAVPLPWPLQFLLFGVLGVAALLLWRKYGRPEDEESAQPTLNQRGMHYVGQVFTLVEPISGGTGKIRVGDTVWLAQGRDAPLGGQVRVVGVNGAVLQVEPA